MKSKFRFLGPLCTYHYVYKSTTHAVLFKGLVFIILRNLMKIITSILEKIVIFGRGFYMKGSYFGW
jgi:hypothetical protein